MTAETAYARDGVDVSAEEEWSKTAYALCKTTWEASPFVSISGASGDHFRLGGGFSWKLSEGMTMDVAADGLGTKPPLIAAAGRYEAAAHDLVAMIAHDLLREGGILAMLTTVVVTESVGAQRSIARDALVRMFTELTNIARTYRIALYKGETAQVGRLLGDDTRAVPFRFMWEGVGHGVFHPDRRVRTNELKAGQVVVALREHGFRCNGISMVRAALAQKFGAEWIVSEAAREHVAAAAAPSILYMDVLERALGWRTASDAIPLYAVAHITGGGIVGKFGEDILFRAGLSAELDGLFSPPQIMRDCAEWRGSTNDELYRVWNGGQGMLLVVDAADASTVCTYASEHGIEARICGTVDARPVPELVIHSAYGDAVAHRYVSND